MCPITGDAFGDDRFDLRDVTYPAFQFHSLRAGLDQRARRRDSLRGIIVGMDRKIGHQQGAFHPARHGPGVMDHFRERDLRGVFVAEHHHTQRVAHQDDVDPAFIEQTSGRIIIGG